MQGSVAIVVAKVEAGHCREDWVAGGRRSVRTDQGESVESQTKVIRDGRWGYLLLWRPGCEAQEFGLL